MVHIKGSSKDDLTSLGNQKLVHLVSSWIGCSIMFTKANIVFVQYAVMKVDVASQQTLMPITAMHWVMLLQPSSIPERLD